MDEYKLHLVSDKFYHYIWHTLADIILEESKAILTNGTDEEKKSRKQFCFIHSIKCCESSSVYAIRNGKIWQTWKPGENLLMVENGRYNFLPLL